MNKGKERRQLRRLARQTFRAAAKDMGLSRLAFAKLIKAKDEDALAALALAAPDEAAVLGMDWGDIDWDAFFETILKFVEMFILIFGMF